MSKLPKANGESGASLTGDHSPNTPRWVKVSGIIVFILVLLVIIMKLVGGNHGPGRHTLEVDLGEHFEQETLGEHTLPEGDH